LQLRLNVQHARQMQQKGKNQLFGFKTRELE